MSAETVEALFQPEMLLPSQVTTRFGTRPYPELRLVAAMVEDALQSVGRRVGSRSPRQRREFMEAWEWLFSDDQAWPFAFVNVCEVLGIDAAAVRRRLLSSVATPRPAAKDARQERHDRRGDAAEHRPIPLSRDPPTALERHIVVGWDEV